jgi:hypothetical protein
MQAAATTATHHVPERHLVRELDAIARTRTVRAAHANPVVVLADHDPHLEGVAALELRGALLCDTHDPPWFWISLTYDVCPEPVWIKSSFPIGNANKTRGKSVADLVRGTLILRPLATNLRCAREAARRGNIAVAVVPHPEAQRNIACGDAAKRHRLSDLTCY